MRSLQWWFGVSAALGGSVQVSSAPSCCVKAEKFRSQLSSFTQMARVLFFWCRIWFYSYLHSVFSKFVPAAETNFVCVNLCAGIEVLHLQLSGMYLFLSWFLSIVFQSQLVYIVVYWDCRSSIYLVRWYCSNIAIAERWMSPQKKNFRN